ncbi:MULTISPECIES: ExbD/TolR family protein [Agarivorans]|jgi:biopolymer transport protein ExbD|uniref:Biopolymer transporter ExbD n=1 Tax=Agarivorans gilvus TaxID=680279 RepID=A0ABQ1I620_9ALTE|nr:biopolymer transporter ExbD [Agarivorans gilvus]GGB19996.1 biopolymer transporter ExbD [Agarivorans gilvus]
MRQSRIFAQQDEEAQIDMTPMLDIVFIMLIFFIVSTSFVREAGIEVQRPEAQTSSEQSQGAVMVALSASGDIWLDRQLTDIRMVRPSLERLKTEQADLAVVVQADEESSTGQLVKLLDQLRLANVPYSVATRAGEQ